MRRLSCLLFLSVVMLYGTDYLNVYFESGTQHSDLEAIECITFSNSGSTIHFNMTNGSVVTDDVSNVNKIVFSTEPQGDQSLITGESQAPALIAITIMTKKVMQPPMARSIIGMQLMMPTV
jgi:hypothetical protein